MKHAQAKTAKPEGQTEKASSLRVSQLGDSLELEADRVAEEVLRGPVTRGLSGADGRPPVQRKCAACEAGGAPCPACSMSVGGRPGAGGRIPLQGKFTTNDMSAQPQGKVGKAENRSGLPGPLKAGLEALSGMDLSGVRVHSNSSKPAQIDALAYTQGQDIHVGPGQEQHLPHEGWHVVQQMQGRVRPTVQAKGGGINDDVGLEREADVMGRRAVQMKGAEQSSKDSAHQGSTSLQRQLGRKGELEAPKANASCPGYAEQEAKISRTQRGHIDPDVSMLRSGNRLLIADFAVNWRSLKDSAKKEVKCKLPGFTAPLETDCSSYQYRIEVIGYSDCVASGGHSPALLREGRAEGVFALLDADTHDRATHREASTGTFVTDNNTIASRAKNRSVVIDRHLELPGDKWKLNAMKVEHDRLSHTYEKELERLKNLLYEERALKYQLIELKIEFKTLENLRRKLRNIIKEKGSVYKKPEKPLPKILWPILDSPNALTTEEWNKFWEIGAPGGMSHIHMIKILRKTEGETIYGHMIKNRRKSELRREKLERTRWDIEISGRKIEYWSAQIWNFELQIKRCGVEVKKGPS